MAAGSADLSQSWTEVQALATRAAVGAGVPMAQALAFGTTAARHLADDEPEAALAHSLAAPETITALALQVEKMIERASLSPRPVPVDAPDADARALLVSWLRALPCRTAIDVSGPRVLAALDLTAANAHARPDRVTLSAGLHATFTTLAARTYVPDSDASRAMGAGAGLMDPD